MKQYKARNTERTSKRETKNRQNISSKKQIKNKKKQNKQPKIMLLTFCGGLVIEV